MIVVKTRKLCVQYFKEINRQLDERKSKFKCLVGFSGEVKFKGDPERYTEKGLNLTIGHDGDVPLGLKNPKYRLLVVANKFQTGFDEPMLQSMYIDKSLKDVQCVQTLSRLNRTMSGKASTFVLDFANDPEAVRFSFQKFIKRVGLEEETVLINFIIFKLQFMNSKYFLLNKLKSFVQYFLIKIDGKSKIFILF